MTGRYHGRVYRVNTLVFDGGEMIKKVMNVAERLALTRKERGFSQARLAKAAGVSQSTVGNIEAGIRAGAESLAALADALGVRYFWLRDGKGDKFQTRLAIDSQTIAEAFDSLPRDTPDAIERRSMLYISIIALLQAHGAGQPSIRGPAPAGPPRLEHRPTTKTQP